jgi:hypothetical protein
MYQTFYDQLGEKNNKNDYYNVVNLNELGVSDRTEIIKELANLRDGMQWQEPGETSTQSISTTTGKDSYNQTTLGITYRFATKKVGDSLNMSNPLWGSDLYDKKTKDEYLVKTEVYSTTIKLNDQVEDFERKIDNLDNDNNLNNLDENSYKLRNSDYIHITE